MLALLVVFCSGFVESYILVSLKTAAYTGLYVLFQSFKFGALGLIAFLFLIPSNWRVHFTPSLLAIAAMIAIYSVVGLLNAKIVPSNVILNIKNNYLWLILLVLIAGSSRKVPPIALPLLFTCSIALGILNVAYSIIVNIYYDGSPRDFYFFDLYTSMGMYGEPNIFRSGHIRSFGLVGSSLTLSQILLIPLSYCLANLFARKNIFVSVSVIIILFTGEWITRTRNPSTALAVSSLALIIQRVTKKNWPPIAFIITYLVGSFYYIVSEYLVGQSNLDLSALYRGAQLLNIFDAILERPLGYGIGYAGVANDSFAVWTDLSFGTILLEVGVIPLLFILAYAFKLLHSPKQSATHNIPTYNINQIALFLISGSLLVLSEYSNIFDSSIFSFSLILGILINHFKHEFVVPSSTTFSARQPTEAR